MNARSRCWVAFNSANRSAPQPGFFVHRHSGAGLLSQSVLQTRPYSGTVCRVVAIAPRLAFMSLLWTADTCRTGARTGACLHWNRFQGVRTVCPLNSESFVSPGHTHRAQWSNDIHEQHGGNMVYRHLRAGMTIRARKASCAHALCNLRMATHVINGIRNLSTECTPARSSRCAFSLALLYSLTSCIAAVLQRIAESVRRAQPRAHELELDGVKKRTADLCRALRRNRPSERRRPSEGQKGPGIAGVGALGVFAAELQTNATFCYGELQTGR